MGIRIKAGRKRRTANPDPAATVIEALKRGGFDPQTAGKDKWESRCPVHDGDRANLSIAKGDDGRVLLHCHAHDCAAEAIVQALGLTLADLFPDQDRGTGSSNGEAPPRSYPTAEDAIAALTRHLGQPTGRWDYLDADSNLVALVVRIDPPGQRKQYRPIHRDQATGRWRISDSPGLWPLYHRPELDGAAGVWFLEGEKCADLARGLGLVATTTAHGARSPHKTDLRRLAGREVVLLPDHGQAGEDYAQRLVDLLADLDPRPAVKIIRLPVAGDGDDIEEWLAERATDSWNPEQCRAELERLADATPVEDLDAAAGEGPTSVGKDDNWPALRLVWLPVAEPFPLDVLPDPVARIVIEASTAVGCDPGLTAGPALAITAGLIGRSASLLRAPNWFARASLFQVNVALPGEGKSPSLEYLMQPIRTIDQELETDFRFEKAVWQAKCKADPKNKPAAPVPCRIVLEDCTLEAMFRVLSANHRGLLMSLDELATLTTGMNQYKGGRGNDLANLMKIWAGAAVVIDRVLNDLGEPIRIPHPCLSVTGNLPPANLVDLVSRRGDVGFVDRWLYVYPDRRLKLKSHQRKHVSDAAVSGWSEVCQRLWERTPGKQDGRLCPHVVYFSDAGRIEFDRLYDDHVDQVNAVDFPDFLRGPWAKLEDYAGRLVLVLVLIWHASDPTADPASLPAVEPLIVRQAWRLVDYFKAHHRRVRAALEGHGSGGAPEGARLVLNWIRNHPEEDTVSERDLTRCYPCLARDRAVLEDALSWLKERKAVRLTPLQKAPAGKPGRKLAPTWEIHPELRTQGHQQNQQNQQNTGSDAESPDGSADFADSADSSGEVT
jgi:hypothetical protein